MFIDSCLLVGIASRNTPTSTVPTPPELGHTGAWDPEVILQNKGISQHLTQEYISSGGETGSKYPETEISPYKEKSSKFYSSYKKEPPWTFSQISYPKIL